jgi:hypothetical protein
MCNLPRIGLTPLMFVVAATVGPSRASAHDVAVGPVAFELPEGLSPVEGQAAPVAAMWQSAAEPLSVTAVVVPIPAGRADEYAREVRDWPGSGRTMIAGFGDSNSKSLAAALSATCSFEGVPVSNDLSRLVSLVTVDTTCNTNPDPTVLRTHIVSVVTASSQVVLRVDSRAPALPSGEAIAKGIWRSLRVSPEQRVRTAALGVEEATASVQRYAPVSGGAGIHLRDYSLTRPSYLGGEVLGGVVAAVLFGAILAVVFIRLGLRPIPALIAGQVLLVVLAAWGGAHEGVWTIDWLVRGIPAVLSIAILRSWAQRRWDRRQLLITANQATAPASPPPSAPQ